MLAIRNWFRHVSVIAFALAAIVLPATPSKADTQDVDLLLVLAADVSRSIDDAKFKLQRDGYASAISDPAIVRAMQSAGPKRRIGLIFIEWAARVADCLPRERLQIAISVLPNDAREFEILATGPRHAALVRRLRGSLGST